MSIENIISELENLNLETPSTDSDFDTNKKELNTGGTPKLKKSNIERLINMAQFKPEYLNCVPSFDGNPNDLNRYLATCQSLVDNFYDNANPYNFQNTYLLNSLVGKLTGQAKLIINIQNVTTWDDLKDTLRRNFADQRDEACLNRDLVMMRQQPNEKPNQFYDRVLHILNLLCSFIDCHETTTTAKALKRHLYNDLALKTFLSGLKEPLGTVIRCMRPTSLMQAMQFVTEESNIHYFQNNIKSNIPIPKNNNNFRPLQQTSLNISPAQPNFLTLPNFGPRPNFLPRPNFVHRPNFFTNAQPSHNFSRPNFPAQLNQNMRPSFNRPQFNQHSNNQTFGHSVPKTNISRSSQQRQLPAPTPMSGVETSTFKPVNVQNPSNYRPPKFVFEELYSADTQSIPQQEQYTFDESQYYFHDQEYFDPQGYGFSEAEPDEHSPQHILNQTENSSSEECPDNHGNFCETPQQNKTP